MKKFALALHYDNRIHHACIVLLKGNYDGMPIVDTLPEGNISDYQYINGEFVYNPLPKEDIVDEITEQPSQLDILDSRVTYLAMMTDNLYWEV